MKEQAVLEAHLRAHPDDWGSWLVYADWLTDQGDVRGELVHLEHALATAPSPEAAQRRRALVEEHRGAWLDGLTFPRGTALRWRGGFVVGIDLGPGSEAIRYSMSGPDPRWLSSLEALARHSTGRLLRTLDLWGRDIGDFGKNVLKAEGARALAQSEALSGLCELVLRGVDLGDEGVIALAQSTALGSLSRLDLSRNWLTDRALHALAHAETLRSLVSLDLSRNNFEAEGIEALVRSDKLPRLAQLSLRGLDAQAAHALVRSCSLPGLVELDLSEGSIGDEPVEALASSEVAPRLTVLRLSGAGLSDAAAAALADAPLGALRVLDLSENWNIGESGVQALATSSQLSLTSLSLRRIHLEDAAIVALARGTAFGSLTELEISGSVSPQTLQELASSPLPRGLTRLGLFRFEGIDPEEGDYVEGALLPLLQSLGLGALTELSIADGSLSVEEIAALPRPSQLRSLALLSNGLEAGQVKILAGLDLSSLVSFDLSGNDVLAEGARALAGSATLRNLESLKLRYGSVGDEGVKALVSSEILRSVETLDLSGNEIGLEGACALAESPSLHALARLALGGNPLGGDEGVMRLAWSTDLPELVDLDLEGIRMSQGAAFSLANEQLQAYVFIDDRYVSLGE